MTNNQTEKHELITYNKKFKPGTVGVKVTFSPDEMAFSREDMPLKAAIARREVLLSLQPQIDGIPRRTWNPDVMVVERREPFNPQKVYLSRKNQDDPDFRRDFYDYGSNWDIQTTLDKKLTKKQFDDITKVAKEKTLKRNLSLADKPGLIRRQLQYAKLIKEKGIPAAQPPPPFVVKKPKLSQGTVLSMKRFEEVKTYHDGAYQYCEALDGDAWSCCGNTDKNSEGCCRVKVNKMHTLYD